MEPGVACDCWEYTETTKRGDDRMDISRSSPFTRLEALKFAFELERDKDDLILPTPLELMQTAALLVPYLAKGEGDLPYGMMPEVQVRSNSLKFAIRQARHSDGIVRLSPQQVLGNAAMFADFLRSGEIAETPNPKCECGHYLDRHEGVSAPWCSVEGCSCVRWVPCAA